MDKKEVVCPIIIRAGLDHEIVPNKVNDGVTGGRSSTQLKHAVHGNYLHNNSPLRALNYLRLACGDVLLRRGKSGMHIPVKFITNEFSSGGGSKGAHAAKPTNGVHRRPTILIVEDEILLRASVGEFLRDSNYRVLEASNANEAKAVLQSKEPIELVFTDIRMPGDMTGFDLAEWVRKQYPDVGVLLTSGFFDLQTTPGYGKEQGPILQKPYSFDALLAQIKRLLLA